MRTDSPTDSSTILALDVGERRVGLAITSLIARLPRPFMTLVRDEDFWGRLRKVIADESVSMLVVGLPRNMQGEETPQSTAIRKFADELQQHTGIKPAMQDETLTSRRAESELNARGKRFEKGDIDALAATYILEDYLAQ